MEMIKKKHSLKEQILVVDDERNIRIILTDFLKSRGHAVWQAGSLAEALKTLGEESFQLLILDVYLPDQEGLEGLHIIKERFPSLPVIIMTAHGTIDIAVEAMKAGAYDFVTKPFDFDRLEVVMDRAIESQRLRSEIDYLRRAADEPFAEIVGVDTGLKATMDMVRQVAQTDTTVLLRGETGSGKEVIARAIHRLSPRRSNPFVVANCAAIPRELMESEMFGHKRGAFTGAISDHAGFFETAGGGTLLLDEIGDLDMELQAKILRVLEDGSFKRVGSSTELKNAARLMASTHQPLEDLINRGRFREDLFYRLNVFPIVIPPLRRRREDIPLLAEHFLRQSSSGRRRGVPSISAGAMGLLLQHPWRGNLRELRNCMERLALTVGDEEIKAADISRLLHKSADAGDRILDQSLEDLEKRAIMAALERFDGNRTKAAEALGISRRTLQKKLKIYEADSRGKNDGG